MEPHQHAFPWLSEQNHASRRPAPRRSGELENEFSWSPSRARLFRDCLRAYYCNHYGAWGGWRADAPPEVRELYVMKNLQNRAQWAGTVVHDVAHKVILSLFRGQPTSPEQAAEKALQQMRRDYRSSQAGLYRSSPKRHCGLQDHYYEEDVSREEWKRTADGAVACVYRIFETELYARLAANPSVDLLTAENLDHFRLEGIKVYVMLDLAFQSKEGRIVIADWKTGVVDKREQTAIQLGVYGYYGTLKWSVDAGALSCLEVNLRSGIERAHPLDEEMLREVCCVVRESVASMRELLDSPERNIASIDRFPMTDELSICRRCSFRRACGREKV